MKIKFLVFCFLLVTGFLVFANSLHNGFMVDDHAFFDEKMRNIKYLPYQFIPDKDWHLGMGARQTDSFYRPLAHVVPMLAFLAFGNNVVGHHAFNIFLWVVAAWMVFIFLETLFADFAIALISAFLFMIHPINGVVVNYITASVFSVQVICMLGSLCFLLYHQKKEAASFWSKGSCFLFSVLFFLLAMMCHETAMALPLYAMMMVMIGRKQSLVQAIKATWWLWLTLIIYFIWRSKYATFSHSILGNFSLLHSHFLNNAATMTQLLGWYLSKLIYPIGIVMNKGQYIAHQGWGMVGWLLILGLMLLGSMMLWWKNRRLPVALMGLSWLALGILSFCFLTLFCPPPNMMILEPHWFIFPVIGFFICMAVMIREAWEKLDRKIVLLGFAMVALTWTLSTRIMNKMWDGDINYYHYWVSESPGFSDPTFDLAMAYQVNKNYDQARYWYRKALDLGYRPEVVYQNLGFIDIMEGHWGEARQYFTAVMKQDPYSATALSNLGIIAFEEKDFKTAQEYFVQAISFDHFAELPRLNLGKTLLVTGRTSEAIHVFEDILTIIPQDKMALQELAEIGMMAQKKGDMKTALAIYHILIKQAPHGVGQTSSEVGFITQKNI